MLLIPDKDIKAGKDMGNPYDYAKANQERFLDEYKHLLRIRTISTQPQHAGDVAEAAEWLKAMMLRIGMNKAEVIKMPEGRCPLVLGEWDGAGPDAPTILIYCHYDVQPAEVADGWDTEPFEPTIKGERLYCRGSVDSKLHVMSNLKAVESWLAQEDKPKVNLKVVLEGEEESGSENINAFIAKHPERLAADIAMISDGAILAPDQPSLTYGLRGVAAFEVHLQAPVSDLHSGHWGGSVHNPIQALCEILAQLHDENGRVTVPGFYDDVDEVTAKDRALLEKVEPFLKAEWDDVVSAPEVWGEPEYILPERLGARPTLEINGMHGGYTGAGMKTVLPRASFRQDHLSPGAAAASDARAALCGGSHQTYHARDGQCRLPVRWNGRGSGAACCRWRGDAIGGDGLQACLGCGADIRAFRRQCAHLLRVHEGRE